MVAAMLWQIFKPEQSRNVVVHLERHTDLLEFTCCTGWTPRQLYRANFIPPLHKPRERYAICHVQAIVLKYDQFVDAELIDEMPKWAEQFQRVEIDANHWAVLSQPEKIADYIKTFAQQHTAAH